MPVKPIYQYSSGEKYCQFKEKGAIIDFSYLKKKTDQT